MTHSAFIALGSNLGNRARNLQNAVRLLNRVGTLKNTSFLYETPPAYYTDQPAFLNAACLIETQLAPHDLLSGLKRIEQELGRQQNFRNGPRNIDLDILAMDELIVKSETLEIPHPRLHERFFVLQPLVDIDPDLRHPILGQAVKDLLRSLDDARVEMRREPEWRRVMPRRPTNDGLIVLGEKTLIMGILNVTPDSFSDGGHFAKVDQAVAEGIRMAALGADIIDIGGESTRPGALAVSPDEQLRRVLPVIEGLRREVDDRTVLSIDTRDATVARAAVGAGADMVNDISGASAFRDGGMGSTIADLAVPYVAMHMRGTPETMQQRTDYGDDVVADVGDALTADITDLVAAGCARWLLVADPGIGFAKTAAQSAELIRGLPDLARRLGSTPLLVGPSRKSFLPPLVAPPQSAPDGSPSPRPLPPSERDAATIGAVCAAAAGGAAFVRVHNVPLVHDALRVFEALTPPSGMR